MKESYVTFANKEQYIHRSLSQKSQSLYGQDNQQYANPTADPQVLPYTHYNNYKSHNIYFLSF